MAASVDRSIRDKAAIVGIGQTSLTTCSGRTELELALSAIDDALADAGLTPSDVDGLVRFGASQIGCSETVIAHNLGIPVLRWWAAIDIGGGASAGLVGQAAAAVASGQADVVVGYRSLNGASLRRPGTNETTDGLLHHDPSLERHEYPHGMTAPSQMFAMVARRHMHKYGTTPAQLGSVAVTTRRFANANPAAQMHDRTMTLDDYFDAPMITSPLRRYDCCLRTDGACAFVVTTAERARDLKQKPVFVKGAVQGTLPMPQGALYSLLARPDLTESPAAYVASTLYERAGVGPTDIDVAELYDCFTITALLQIEDYGFCAKGEAGPFVEGGNTGPGGTIPVNTAGGNLSEGYLHGVNHVIEGVRQLRGTAASQVEGAELCLVTGGLPTPTTAVILGSVAG